MAATTLPIEPTDGHTLIFSDDPNIEFVARAGEIAIYVAGVWTWFEPSPGWIIWDETNHALRVYDGDVWVSGSAGSTSESLPKLGVNMSAQDHQRLAVSSEGTLFTHKPNLA